MDKKVPPILEEDDILSFFDDFDDESDDSNLFFGHFYEGSGLTNEATVGNVMEGRKEGLSSNLADVDVLNSLDMQQENTLATNSSVSPGVLLPVSVKGDNTMSSVPSSQQDLSILHPKETLPPNEAAAGNNHKEPSLFEIRKAMKAEELATIALKDPKRAKRILMNRLSAVRAKDRRRLEINVLEHKWKDLQSKLTQVDAEQSKMQAENKNLSSENTFLKERNAMVLRQLKLQDSLNEKIKADIRSRKSLLGPIVQTVGAGTCPLLDNNAPHPMQVTQQPPNLQMHYQNHFQPELCEDGFQQPYCEPNTFEEQPSFQNPQPCLNEAQNERGQGAVPLPSEPEDQLLGYEQLGADEDFDFLLPWFGENGNDI